MLTSCSSDFKTPAFPCCATQRKHVRSESARTCGSLPGACASRAGRGPEAGRGRICKHPCVLPHLPSRGTSLRTHRNYSGVWDPVQLMRNRFSAVKPIGEEASSPLKPFTSQPIFSLLCIACADPLFLVAFVSVPPFFPLSLCHVSKGEIDIDVYAKIGQMWFCSICSMWETNTKGGNNS